MTTATVRNYLENRLKTFADARSPVLKIAFENVAFTKPTTMFLECFLLPSATITATLRGNRKREVGIFQINIWSPSNSGTAAASALAQDIVDLFPIAPKTSTTDVSIEKIPCVERSLVDTSGWYVTPILIYYRLES